MYILHVFDHSLPLQSGYAFRSQAIINEQRALGWRTEHVTSSKHNNAAPDAPDEETVAGLHFYRTAPARGILAGLPVLNQLAVIRELQARLARIVRAERPDILQAHSPALNALAAIGVGRRFGIPVVYEVRASWEDAAVSHGTSREGGLRYRLSRLLETHACRRADAITCICDGLRRDLVERGIARERITLVPNAVDVREFSPIGDRDASLAAELGLAGAPVVGFVGSFYAYEGLDVLLAALPKLAEGVPDVRLLLVGGGPAESALRAQAAALGIADRVLFTGRVPHDQVYRYYSLIDVLAYPRHSMRLTELVTPLKPLEAMAQERVLVASDVGGHRELIRDGETGLLFTPGDADDLARKLTRMFAERERWCEWRAAGRRFVESERTWPASVANYQPVYRQLLAAA